MSALAAIVRAYGVAARRVMADPTVWAEELARVGAGRLPWPPPVALCRTKWDRLHWWLLVHLVDLVRLILHESGDPVSPGLRPSADDPRWQAMLRVARRADAAGEAAVRAWDNERVAAGGDERFCIAREYKNLWTEEVAELALQAGRLRGWTRDEAFAFFGLPRRQAFRAIKRRLKRRRTRRK